MNIYGLFINGKEELRAATMPVFNPANEETIAHVSVATPDDADLALRAARQAQPAWARLPGIERGAILRRWADLLDQHRDSIVRLITDEVGKPLHESRGEFDFGNSWFRYYAEFDRRMTGEILPADRPDEQLLIYPAPVGVVVGIIAWNYPFAVAIRKIAPALIAGNSLVLKPHEDTPLSALAIARLANQAGVPPGVFQVLPGLGSQVGEELVKSSIPRLVTFTGSVKTGRHIARVAADTLKLVSLEMGGKAPFIVMEDCDLDLAVSTAVASRFVNCGQLCIANERTYVHQRIARDFTERFVAATRALSVGSPLDPNTRVGPKINRVELEKTERSVKNAVASGARVLTGGHRLSEGIYSRGHWFAPTVLAGVRQEMAIIQEETFGPVVPILEFAHFSEAMELANDSRYGLAAYLFTRDVDRIFAAIRNLDVGELYVNRGPAESVHGYHSGWKMSGIGGDDGHHGLQHYQQRKTVYLKHSAIPIGR